MKAILCKTWGGPESLILEEVPSPVVGPSEVRIAVHACGVNFADTLMIAGHYQVKPPFPFSPGLEVAGHILDVGESVTHLKVGTRVVALCGYGGFAEEVIAPANVIFPKPPMMDYETASCFMMAYGTSYHALKDRANLQAGETLLVLGASGGVGLAAIQLGKLMGAKVIAAASSAEKLAICTEHGADLTINYAEEDLKTRIKELTDGKGADVVYDPVGGDYTEAALRSTAWEGRFLIVGFPAGIARVPMNLPLLKGCQIVGVFWGSFVSREPAKNMANTMEIINWFANGDLKPHIDKVYALADAPQALQDMMDRKVRGKIVIKP